MNLETTGWKSQKGNVILAQAKRMIRNNSKWQGFVKEYGSRFGSRDLPLH